MDEASSPLLELLSTPSVMGLLLMLSIIFNAIVMIWCTSAYEDPYFVLDTNLRITALWRDYTPCGILAVFSGRRQRGTTAGEALEALNLRREANRQAEAEALALAVAKSTIQQPRGSSRSVNKPKNTTRRAIRKPKRTRMREESVRFLMDDCLLAQGFAGENLRTSTSTSSTSESRGQLGPRSYRRTSFRKINVTYKRPLPPFPVCTFEDNNVKIVISDIYDRYEIPKSELNQGTSHHRYEYLDEEDSRGAGFPVRPEPRLDDLYEPVGLGLGAGVPVRPEPRLDDLYEPVGLGPFPYTEELEVFV